MHLCERSRSERPMPSGGPPVTALLTAAAPGPASTMGVRALPTIGRCALSCQTHVLHGASACAACVRIALAATRMSACASTAPAATFTRASAESGRIASRRKAAGGSSQQGPNKGAAPVPERSAGPSSAAPLGHETPLESPCSSDAPTVIPFRVAVVGAGLAGVATAWHLMRHAPRNQPLMLHLYDAAGIAAGGSGAAAGLLHPYNPRGKLLWRGEEAMAAAIELVEAAEAAAGAAPEAPPIEDELARVSTDPYGRLPPASFVWRHGVVRPAGSAKQAGDIARALGPRVGGVAPATSLQGSDGGGDLPGRAGSTAAATGTTVAGQRARALSAAELQALVPGLVPPVAATSANQHPHQQQQAEPAQQTTQAAPPDESNGHPPALALPQHPRAFQPGNDVLQPVVTRLSDQSTSHPHLHQQQPAGPSSRRQRGSRGSAPDGASSSGGRASGEAGKADAGVSDGDDGGGGLGGSGSGSGRRTAGDIDVLSYAGFLVEQGLVLDVGSYLRALWRSCQAGARARMDGSVAELRLQRVISLEQLTRGSVGAVGSESGDGGKGLLPGLSGSSDGADVGAAFANGRVGDPRAPGDGTRGKADAVQYDMPLYDSMLGGYDAVVVATGAAAATVEEVRRTPLPLRLCQGYTLVMTPPQPAHERPGTSSPPDYRGSYSPEGYSVPSENPNGYPPGSPSLLGQPYLAAQGPRQLVVGATQSYGWTPEASLEACLRSEYAVPPDPVRQPETMRSCASSSSTPGPERSDEVKSSEEFDTSEGAQPSGRALKDDGMGGMDAVEQLRVAASALWRPLQGWRVERVREGVRALPPRMNHGSLPLLGRLAPDRPWWLVAGLGSRGLVYHGLVGRLAAQAVIADSEEGLPRELTAWRGLKPGRAVFDQAN